VKGKIAGRMFLVVGLILLILLLAGCGTGMKTAEQATGSAGGDAGRASNAVDQSKVPGMDTALAAVGDPYQPRKVIRNAEMGLEVEELPVASRLIEERVDQLGGLVADASSWGSGKGERRGEMTIRIPSHRFAAFLLELETWGEMKNRRIFTQDVTEEYLDLESRAVNLERQEERLRQILDQAKTVEEILRVERELERVRGEIETIKGKLRYLKDRVDYSTIRLNLWERKPGAVISANNLEGVWGRSVNALINSVNGILAFMGNLTVFLFALFPVAVLLLAAALAGRLVYRRVLPRLRPAERDRGSS